MSDHLHISQTGPRSREPRGVAPVRVAVVGVGEMGQRHVRVFAACAGAEVVGVVDLDAGLADAVAARFDVARFADEAEAIARAQLVVVATPAAAHAATVERALGAGRHVLVEKPVCTRAADAERLVALAERRGARLFVGHSERYNPVVRALAQRVSPEEIRAIELVRVGPPVSTRRRAPASEGGVLLNLGVHDIDLAAYLGRARPALRRADGDDARAALTLALGDASRDARGGAAIARIVVDREACERRRAVRVTTDDATYEGDLLAPRLVRLEGGRAGAMEVPLSTDEPLAAQAAGALAALAGAPSEIATGRDGARALDIAERATALLAGAPRDAASRV